MLWYKLKLYFRSLRMDKLNSSINIFGLAVGMAAVILISLYVQHELSYDKFNVKHARIYRLLSLSDFSNQKETCAVSIHSVSYCKRILGLWQRR